MSFSEYVRKTKLFIFGSGNFEVNLVSFDFYLYDYFKSVSLAVAKRHYACPRSSCAIMSINFVVPILQFTSFCLDTFLNINDTRTKCEFVR